MTCDGGHYECETECTGDVVPVNVTHPSGRNWGTFWYCTTAIEEDERRGFRVTRLTLDGAAREEEARRGE